MIVTGAVSPADMHGDFWTTVSDGAVAAGQHGDAVLRYHADELRRRAAVRLGAVTNRSLLHALLHLPWGTAVHNSSVSPKDAHVLSVAPPGVVDRDGCWFIRRLTPPLTVVAALVEGTDWRATVTRAAAFAPFCQMVTVFPGTPRNYESLAWEASVDGIGVWIREDGALIEVVAPTPFRAMAWKAAGWAFHENAYRIALTPTCPGHSSFGRADHQVRTEHVASGRQSWSPPAGPN